MKSPLHQRGLPTYQTKDGEDPARYLKTCADAAALLLHQNINLVADSVGYAQQQQHFFFFAVE